MTHADFVHLRVHTAYSLSEGAIKIGDLVDLCKAGRMPAVAITDTGNLFGALEFSLACRRAGLQPVIGCQLAVAREGAQDQRGGTKQTDSLILLAQDRTGYGNLLKLASRAFLETDPGEPPHVTIDDLEPVNHGLIALTGGTSGAIGRLLAEGQKPAAEAMLRRLGALFPDRLYMELARQGAETEQRIEADLIELAYAQDVPLVATNEAFFSDETMHEAHDALICVAEGTYVAEQNRRRLTPEFRLKSAEEMRALFADIPEAVNNTLVIARRCAVMSEQCEPILPAFATEGGRDEATQLKEAANRGLDVRLEAHVFTDDMDSAAREAAAVPYRERLEYELSVIQAMGFPGYFLIVADFIQWAKQQGIPVGPGRGSGAGSVVAWALTITDLDPLRWGLLFERFLNPDRISMPDFDIDFCQDRRDEVIRYVQEKYGADRVAQIITFGKLQARAVLRDVGRVLQMPYGQVDRICKLVPNNPANPVTLRQAIDGEPQLQDMRRNDATVARLIDIALKLEGLYRHASTHAAGVVIGDRPLDELVPLYRDPRSSMPVTQFNMKFVEMAGLVKFDFLGLKTLTVLAQAQDLLRRRGVELDLAKLPLDDPAAYEMMSRGDTTGVFQLEGSGMRQLLREAKVGTFEDIIALVALYRPGPMENIPRYVACKHGHEQPELLHETIVPVTRDTYGVIIYQEQVMQIAQVFAGFTLAQADILRKAMGKKIKSEMAAQRDAFVAGAVERGVARDRASYVFDLVDKFAGYGFNKAHSAGYALVAYQTAYLKANHPVEFFAASMTLDMGNTDKLGVFRRELDRQNIPLLPPDVNLSDAVFSVDQGAPREGAIRYALAALKNVGRQAMDALVAEREAKGPFTSLANFADRLDTSVINRRQLENLVRAGAFDSLNRNRRQVFEAVETMIRLASSAANERASNQTNLFGDSDDSPESEIPLADVPDWPDTDRLRNEFEAVGFYLSAHPLDEYAPRLASLGVVASTEIPDKAKRGAKAVKLAGAVLGSRERNSARGNRYAFIQLSDSGGEYEVTAFSETLAASRDLLGECMEGGLPVLVTAELRADGDTWRITAQSLERLDMAVSRQATCLRIHVVHSEALPAIRTVMEREKPGRGRFTVVMERQGQEIEVALPGHYAISTGARAAIKGIAGIRHVEEV